MSHAAKFAAVALALLVAACAPAPIRTSLPVRWKPSPNFDERRPNFVILHHTSNDTVEGALATLTDPARQVSAHFVLERDGTIYQLVDERLRAWHAGESRWGATTDLNSSSIGIELDNNGSEPYPEPQIVALLALLADLQARYRIPAANFIGHGDVAPGRKVDPGAYFPWRRLAQAGFGLWCDPSLEEPPPGFDPWLALRALGYDTANPEAAAKAFNRHFMRQEDSAEMTPEARRMLRCLVELPR